MLTRRSLVALLLVVIVIPSPPKAEALPKIRSTWRSEAIAEY